MFKYREQDKFFIYDRPKYIGVKYYLKYFIILIYEIIIKIILYFYNKKLRKINREKKYYISICSIFKNEAKYFEEWLEYHMMIGVEHFYLYNNFSEDNYLEILAPYVEKGIVTLIEWPIAQGQLSAYDNCYTNFKEESQWICFLDLDEFICMYDELNIKNWLKKYINYPSIVVYWKMFGTSGKINREKELVIEEFNISWEKLLDIGKVFFNTNFIMKKNNVHSVETEINFWGIKLKIPNINEFKRVIKGGINRASIKKEFTIQINHYWSRTFSEYINNKMKRGDVFFNYQRINLEYFYLHEIKNKSCDYKIYRFLIKLKEQILEKNNSKEEKK